MINENIEANVKEGQYTKRIVSNSVFLFIRMLVVTVITLYSVRFVLKGLGVEQYGVFNAVAGIVLTGTFVIPVLATSVQRFYSFALGINDAEMLRNLFSVSINIIIALIVMLIVILETIGLWYVNCHLVIPDGMLPMVNVVYQMTILSFTFTLLLVPFTAVIFSHENMMVYAILSCVDCALKCILAIAIIFVHNNTLMLYSAGLLLVSFVMLLMYGSYTCRKYKECKYHKVDNRQIYMKLLSFCGWTTYGAISGTAIIQGSVMILNFFFGPLANAAFAVSNNLYNAFNSLANSVVLSFRPAMTKLYAQQDNDILNHLFYLNNKIILYLMGAISLPVIFEMPFILKIWLGEITPEMIIYSRLFILYSLCLVMHNPITTIVQSTGNIKKYSLLVETMMLGSLPVAVILFKLGFPSYYIFIAFIACCVLAHLLRLYCLNDVYPTFSCLTYLKDIVLRGAVVLLASSVLVFYCRSFIENDITQFVVTFLLTPLLLFTITYVVGLSKNERNMVIKLVKHQV